MAIEKREQVFISSTFKDLIEERRAILQTLLEADCIPAGMELFPASDDEKFDLIKRVIDLCDYYVVVVGGRYGSVDDVEQLSYTEMEFDYAVKKKKPVMGFLHGNPGNLPVDKVDIDQELRKKLDKFRSKIEAKMVKYWNTPGDLSGQVALALIQIRKSHPAEGWIRANQAMTAEDKAELVELRAKVRELSAELKDEKRHYHTGVDPAELVQGDELAEVRCGLEWHWQSQIDTDNTSYSSRIKGTWSLSRSWNDVFRYLGPKLLDEASEYQMTQSLSKFCRSAAREELIGEVADDDESDTIGAIQEAHIHTESFHDIVVQFMALGLIEKGTKKRTGSDRNTYWKLTDEGSQQLMRLRAIRRAMPSEVNPDAEG